MKNKISLIFIGVFAFIMLALTSMGNYKSKKLLFEDPIYGWKIYYVTENRFPVGKRNFYEVYHQDKLLVIPKNIAGTKELSRFAAAFGYAPLDPNYTIYSGTVAIVFNYTERNEKDGFLNSWTVMVRVKYDAIEKKFLFKYIC